MNGKAIKAYQPSTIVMEGILNDLMLEIQLLEKKLRFGAVILSVTILSILPGTCNGWVGTQAGHLDKLATGFGKGIPGSCCHLTRQFDRERLHKNRHSLVFLPALLLAILSEPWKIG